MMQYDIYPHIFSIQPGGGEANSPEGWMLYCAQPFMPERV